LHGEAVRNLIGRVAIIEMVGPVLACSRGIAEATARQ
jgi:hypothetical protein